MWGRFPTFFYYRRQSRHSVNDELQSVVAQEVEALGYDLVELRRGGTKGRPVLDVRIDRRDEQNVSVEDCTRVSRAIEARLDAGTLVSDRYVLEVSSPGAERPLHHAADWRRFVGRQALVTTPSLAGGKAEVAILAVEGDAGAEVVLLRDARDVEHRVPLADVTQARLTFHWKR